MEKPSHFTQAFQAYQKRLQNLPTVLTQLHSLIAGDEVVGCLVDSAMEKYRIDRINEIVLEVLNSEKEKMLIRALEKCEELAARVKEYEVQAGMDRSVNKQDRREIEELEGAKQRYEEEVKGLRIVIEKYRREIQEKDSQLENFQAKIKASQKPAQIASLNQTKQCFKCEKLNQKIIELVKEKQIANELISKLKNDGENAVSFLNQKIRLLTTNNQQLKQRVGSKKDQVDMPQDPSSKKQINRRNQKIEVMKRQIQFVQSELLDTQKKFTFIKDAALGQILGEVRKARSHQGKLQQFIRREIEDFKDKSKQVHEKLAERLHKPNLNKMQLSFRPEKLLSKLNQLDNELDYFIENEIVAD